MGVHLVPFLKSERRFRVRPRQKIGADGDRSMRSPHVSLVILLPIVLLIAFPLAAEKRPSFCGPSKEKYTIVEHGGEHPLPKAAPDKALIYVIGWGHFALGHERVAVNGKWVAYVGKGTYTYLVAEPGLLKFCKEFPVGGSPYLFLTVEAGKIYYVKTTAVGKGGLLQLEDSEAESLIRKCRFVTMKLRH